MKLPEYVSFCIRALENAGYEAYAVGGCVRDDLLGLVPHDYDLCSSALPEQIASVFSDLPQVHTGMQHGTVSIVFAEGTVEITTYRREGSYRDNRHPDWVDFVTDLREDLARRDFTVNAIAWSPIRGYSDPFDGRKDLKAGILRAVGDPDLRFREDALRILRGIRFAARFRLAVEEETAAAMERQAARLDHLAAERVFAELCGFLPRADAADLQRFAPVLCQVIPELAPMVGFDQHSPHHAYDVYTHTAYVLQAVPEDLPLRWAALLHDIGKIPTFTQDANGRGHFYGHAHVGAGMADGVLRRLRAPNDLREQAVFLIENHMTRLTPDKVALRRLLSRCGAQTLNQLFQLQQADMASKGTAEHQGSDHFPKVKALMETLEREEGRITLKTLAIGGDDLLPLGFRGKAIGECLSTLLDQVLEERIPNDREALLQAAANIASLLSLP